MIELLYKPQGVVLFMKFKGMILLFTSMSLLMGCSPASSNEPDTAESHYFKNVAESIEAGISE